ncbi:MAG: hypothetical protein J6Z08_10045 [Elusimicrobiales bacterium]|nr:hypothetical protein [Elusimicrobiales bacterium]
MMTISEKIKHIKDSYIKASKAGRRLFIIESALGIALIIALMRLAFMQLLPHASYERFYRDNFMPENISELPRGTISDRNGVLLVSDDFSADVYISTSSLARLSYPQRKKCARTDISYGEKIFETAGYSLKDGKIIRELEYRPDCAWTEAENLRSRSYFIDRFRSDNPGIFDEIRCSTSSAVRCRNLNIMEYQEIQRQLKNLREYREMINGFKFDFTSGTLNNLCLAVSQDYSASDESFQQDIRNITVAEIRIGKTEKRAMKREELREYIRDGNMPVAEYCRKYPQSGYISIGLVLSEIYERNRFTPQLLHDLYENLSEEEKLKIKETEKLQTTDQKILKEKDYGRYYCSDGYDSILCKKLYEYNLNRIADFFETNKKYFENADKIVKDIKSYTEVYPGGRDKVYTVMKERLKGRLAAFGWGISDVADYIISVLKLKEDYQRKVRFADEKDEKTGVVKTYLVVNKKKARQPAGFSGNPLKGLSGTALVKAKDEVYRKFASELNDMFIKAGQPEPLNADERDYVHLVSVKPEIFHTLLPEVRYLSGIYSPEGMEFSIDRNARSYAMGTAISSSPLPPQAAMKPEDYILAPLLGQTEGTGSGIDSLYAEALASGNKRSGITDIKLTIDSRLQNLAELLLRRRGEELGAERGFVLVQKVNTGEIAAAASYNPEWKPGFSVEMLNFNYQPGSTFKPFTVAIALESGIVKENDLFNLKKAYEAGKNSKERKVSRAWNKISDDHALQNGSYSLKDIIAASSNIGTARVAELLWDRTVNAGGEKIKGQVYMKKMRAALGIGEKTGLGTQIGSGENAGHLAPADTREDEINYMDYLKDAYGQGPVDLTPVQLVSAYSALLNGGTLYEPYIISSVEYRNGTRIDRSPEAKREKLFSPETLSAVREYMKAVFETRKSAGLPEAVRGTGAAYAIKGFEWGGKTGTADKLVKGQKITASCPKSSKERVCNPNRASFIGFLPYEKPEYVILVMFDESEKAAREKGIHPSGAGAGGAILKRMAEEIINIEGYTYINSGTDAEVKK